MPHRVVDVLVEIPKGSQNKYVWDSVRRRVRLDRVLASSIHYPADYGFIPGTMIPGVGPLHALVLVSSPTVPGCLVSARVIGCLKTIDEKGPDTKIITVPTGDPRCAEIETLTQVSPHIRKEIEYFFAAYKALEDKRVEMLGWGETDEALNLIESLRV